MVLKDGNGSGSGHTVKKLNYVNHGLTMGEAGRNEEPNLRRLTFASVVL